MPSFSSRKRYCDCPHCTDPRCEPQAKPMAPQRNLTRAEKMAMRNWPAMFGYDAPVTVDASIPVGAIKDFNDLADP